MGPALFPIAPCRKELCVFQGIVVEGALRTSVASEAAKASTSISQNACRAAGRHLSNMGSAPVVMQVA